MSSLDSAQEDRQNLDPREADALYKTLPSFEEWLARCSVDDTRWDRYTAALRERRKSSPELLPRAFEIVRRAAAFDTGALEGLYETDRGFTITVAMQSAFWEAAVEKKGPDVRAFFESQLHVYDYILDLATEAVPIAEAWIRKLHAEICASQRTYRVWTEIGWQEQMLPKGEYKHLPNHVLLADGAYHAYAPVDMTPTEMYRFCEELRSPSFVEAHPILQAAYAHYGLVVIHPFADGNGRVARALGSVFTFRAESIPLLVLVDKRGEYLASLRAADASNYQAFVDFTLESALDALQMASESIRAATVPSVEEGVAEIKRLYKSKGGYTHAEIDEAGFKFIELLQEEFAVQLGRIGESAGTHVTFDVTLVHVAAYNIAKPTSRLPRPSGRCLVVVLRTARPADARITRRFGIEVPMDSSPDEDLTIHDLTSNELFEARVTTLLPEANTAFRMRLSIWVQRVVGELLRELSSEAARSLRTKGY